MVVSGLETMSLPGLIIYKSRRPPGVPIENFVFDISLFKIWDDYCQGTGKKKSEDVSYSTPPSLRLTTAVTLTLIKNKE
jgi:hypothetical protein